MSIYADNTSVSVERSRGEIESTLARFGAAEFAYMTDKKKAAIQFVAAERKIRFILPLPDSTSDDFTKTPGRRRERSSDEAYRAWEQACREQWRALALSIKAKLVAVRSGITTFEEEFLAHIVLPGGKTVWETTHEKIRLSYKSGKVAPLIDWQG
jgi:hypothetical protein